MAENGREDVREQIPELELTEVWNWMLSNDASISLSHFQRQTAPAELHLNTLPPGEVESDCSWAEDDTKEDWYTSIQKQLHAFRRTDHRCSVVTTALASRERSKIHAMCHLLQLSHLSVGIASPKRIIISKCEIKHHSSTNPTGKGRPWNPSKMSWMPGYVDPLVLSISNIWTTVPILERHFDGLDIQQPREVTITMEPKCVALALFETPLAAAEAMIALDGTSQSWGIYDAPIACEFLRLPTGHQLTDSMRGELDLLKKAIDSAPITDANLGHVQAEDIGQPAHKFPQLARDEGLALEFASSLGVAYDSAGPYRSKRESIDAATDPMKRIRRQPKASGAYPCGICDKCFDRECDRRKHQHSHWKLQPYKCQHCGQGFRYPKDVRRHEERKHQSKSSLLYTQSNSRDPFLVLTPNETTSLNMDLGTFDNTSTMNRVRAETDNLQPEDDSQLQEPKLELDEALLCQDSDLDVNSARVAPYFSDGYSSGPLGSWSANSSFLRSPPFEDQFPTLYNPLEVSFVPEEDEAQRRVKQWISQNSPDDSRYSIPAEDFEDYDMW